MDFNLSGSLKQLLYDLIIVSVLTINLGILNHVFTLENVYIETVDFFRIGFENFISIFFCPAIENIGEEIGMNAFDFFFIALD